MEAKRPKVHGDDNVVTKCDQLLCYIPDFLGQLSDSYYEQCARLDNWQQRRIFLFGRWSKIPRLTLWYSMSGKSYTYSGMTMNAKPYPPVIEKIANQVTKFSDLQFNSVLLNRFRNGSDKIGWHSDNEKCLGEIINIATISLGAERHLLTKRPGDKKSVELELEHGSLLLMKHPFQHKWLHCIPPRKHQNGERISLTFRTIVTAQDST